RVYRRVDAVLGGEDQSGDFAHVTPDLALAIREILTETKPDFSRMLGLAADEVR
ncbi:MAG: hypothetical protein GWN85_25305, partial [Gemmatimonadetes bacterium]|nr:hypothetical protein [Gemmatimonadota bacterium]NIR38817.1 hypothetical protein [Actinomycetota bacterium]NIU68345.1 hypothetical protein [Actinomycetota bacterium]NIX22584.1 hypothetical protein [Actinomycetota bacterium]